MEEEKSVNKKIKENIFNLKIPSFLNDPKSVIIIQRNIEDDKFAQIEKVYEISQNICITIIIQKKIYLLI